jgi:hypothetical protein
VAGLLGHISAAVVPQAPVQLSGGGAKRKRGADATLPDSSELRSPWNGATVGGTSVCWRDTRSAEQIPESSTFCRGGKIDEPSCWLIVSQLFWSASAVIAVSQSPTWTPRIPSPQTSGSFDDGSEHFRVTVSCVFSVFTCLVRLATCRWSAASLRSVFVAAGAGAAPAATMAAAARAISARFTETSLTFLDVMRRATVLL